MWQVAKTRSRAAKRPPGVSIRLAVDAELQDGSPRPSHIRSVRALGPTVRPDLTLKPADPEIGNWVI